MLIYEELAEYLKSKKIQKFRADQIMYAICKEGKESYSSISTIPKEMQEALQKEVPILCILPMVTPKTKDRKTEKVLFKTGDNFMIEAVLMKFGDGRNTVCVSSQIGCQLGCTFCATGAMKFGRNLTYQEIADQVLYFQQQLLKKKKHVTNIVYMGMGEPFMNYDAVTKSLRALNHPKGLNIGARNITVSTSGICEGIERLASEPIQVNLAVSLHAPNQDLRAKIMPIARKYTLERLMEAIEEYIEKTNRRVSYEYVMLKGINDSEKEARELAELIKYQLCHVNLIPYNATGIDGISGSERQTIDAFKRVVEASGVPITVRVSLGQEIDAACGQLANKAQHNIS